jgi:cytochrome b pre-mRNA-processing protein 3
MAEKLYWQIVDISRNPKIYKDFLIPDTLDGRFDSLLLHLFLVIHQLKHVNKTNISNQLLDFFIKDMDRSLRETGVGDPSISRKMRKVGEAYMGRMHAYADSIENTELLTKALHKNIYRQHPVSEKIMLQLANYVLQYKQFLINNFNIKNFNLILPQGILPNE